MASSSTGLRSFAMPSFGWHCADANEKRVEVNIEDFHSIFIYLLPYSLCADAHARKHRIFKSLAAIMILVVGSYFLICILRLLYASVNNTFFQLHISPCISAVLTSTAATSNPVLLFAFRFALHFILLCQLVMPGKMSGWGIVFGKFV
jgi:hypothetical protein